ncbi:MAG: family 2 glycosyl transferase [Phycisphaeraceae bacterium]|nr:family 2 glycosyl transferase [Phycisphaeraceae bacterium]
MNDPGQGVHVVVPVHNEAEVLGEVLGDLVRRVPAGQVVVVDDGSSDDSARIARSRGVGVLRHLINRGQGAALTTGIQAALRQGARIIVTFDGDGQHDSADIAAMVLPIQEGNADVVLATRFHDASRHNIPGPRRLVLRLGVLFTRIVSWIRVSDTHNGLRALSRDAAERIHIRQDGMAHASEILDEIKRLRLRYTECPANVTYSKYSMAKGQRSSHAFKLALQIILQKVGG